MDNLQPLIDAKDANGYVLIYDTASKALADGYRLWTPEMHI